MIKDFLLMVWCLVYLAAWAIWKTVQVKMLRVAGYKAMAARVEAEADTAMRQLCGVPEPGQAWDS